MQPTKGSQTSEFNVTMLCQLVASVLVAVGVLNPAKAGDFVNAFVIVAAAVISAGPSVAYIWGRTWLKGKAVAAAAPTVQAPLQPATTTVVPEGIAAVVQTV